MRSARVLLTDDHALVRHGLRLIVDGHPTLRVVAEAGDGQEAIEVLQREPVDLVIMDLTMPRLGGMEATRRIKARWPDVAVLVLSMHDNEQLVHEALESGADGYVLKSAVDQDLLTACLTVLDGRRFLQGPAPERTATGSPLDVLTPRETEVLKLIAEGASTREIATALTVAESTVENHRTNILAKLGMRDRVELTRFAIRVGLTEA
jgi:DNA-binding NarL/FixJ family response regulator